MEKVICRLLSTLVLQDYKKNLTLTNFNLAIRIYKVNLFLLQEWMRVIDDTIIGYKCLKNAISMNCQNTHPEIKRKELKLLRLGSFKIVKVLPKLQKN